MKKSTKKVILILLIIGLLIPFMLLIGSLYEIHGINTEYSQRYDHKNALVSLRKFPYPYRAALSICSDLDNTETLKEFTEISKYLHTDEMTSLGKGLGLEVGNSFFFYEPPSDAISYYGHGPEVAQTFIEYIKVGTIDSIHSYGKKADFTRKDAIQCLNELKKNDCRIDVWVDHTRSIDNLGDDVTFGNGDHPESNSYHADLTIDYGIKYVWLGRVTMIIGQAVPIGVGTFYSIYDSKHPFMSLANVSKEIAKNVLAVMGNKKYEMHLTNDLIKEHRLDDRQKVYEFIRFDNHWKGVGAGADSNGLAYTISKKTLERLKKVAGYMIVYTHLGKNSGANEYLPEKTRTALKNLASEFKAGQIYVTTTSKLLNYYVTHKYLKRTYDMNRVNNEIMIYVHSIDDPVFGKRIPNERDLKGITFYVPKGMKARLFINNDEIYGLRNNLADHSGNTSITIINQ